MNNVQEQLNRMKAMMGYGLQTENKKNFATLEYNRVGPDGKMYGIVREGTKFYIKVSNKSKDFLKEDFDYIGGFRNRKSNEYTSYANALKHFDINMRSLSEACGKEKKYIAESWNPEKQEFVMVEATQKMKDEIARQRQIMGNAKLIAEGKDGECVCGACDCSDSQKNNGNLGKHGVGDAKTADDTFSVDPKDGEDLSNIKGSQKNNIGKPQKPITEGDNGTLAWHKDGGDAQETIADTYLDTSNGTSIGDSAPFDKGKNDKSEMHHGTVEEDASMAMDCGDNQNSPAVGVGEVGDDDPFTTKAKNGLQEADELDGEDVDADIDADIEDDEPMIDGEGEDVDGLEPDADDADLDLDAEGDDLDIDADLEGDDLGLDAEEDEFDDGLSSEGSEIAALKADMQALKDMLANISDKLGVSSEATADAEFNDEPLYGDDDLEGEDEDFEDDTEYDLDLDSDDNFDAEGDDLEGEDEDFEDDDDEDVFESRSYRRMKSLKEDKLDYFGKHPAWRKHVMTLPPTGEDKNAHGEDLFGASVHQEKPYAEKIGDGAPFAIDPQVINNSVAESIQRMLKGRKNL